MKSHAKVVGVLAVAGWIISGCAGKIKGGLDDDDIYGRLSAKKNRLMGDGILAEVAVAKSKDLQTGINKVELEARGKLTRAVEAKTSTLQKQFKEEVGEEFLDHFTQVSKSVASTVLVGTTMLESPYREKDGEYEVFGIIAMDPKTFKEALAEQLAANEAIKARWQASRGYAELEREAQAYDKYKREMTQPPAEPSAESPKAPPSEKATATSGN